ncbi:unnamed protein product [Schistosoma mansoni]|uniref:Smp_206140 n=1 Tax=Schistosoma mansoni TaxID=6183 RepID=UPI00022C8739|nr:unnamed protein product [Schistosoma mansoni]|eukprot:XP_018644816.1 unnamed protein product [Schistosoma mansoni]
MIFETHWIIFIIQRRKLFLIQVGSFQFFLCRFRSNIALYHRHKFGVILPIVETYVLDATNVHSSHWYAATVVFDAALPAD